jgi:hypothetical protein
MPTPTNSFDKIISVLEEHHGVIASNRPIPAERRFKFRYPLNLSVRFRCLSRMPIFSSVGRTVNLSSSGVLVVSQQVVPQAELGVNARLEMNIEWPSVLEGRVPLQLFAVGIVVRRGASDFAATFERYQFRTIGSSKQPPGRVGGGVIEWPPNKVKVFDRPPAPPGPAGVGVSSRGFSSLAAAREFRARSSTPLMRATCSAGEKAGSDQPLGLDRPRARPKECAKSKRIRSRNFLSLYAGLRQPVFGVSQDPLNDKILHEEDFSGRSHLDVFRHPNPVVDARLLHHNV